MPQEFLNLIKSAAKIMVTAHVSPDPDAVTSTLLLGQTLKTNFPDKQIYMVLEEEPVRLDFIAGYNDLVFQPITEALEQLKPDLFILLDGNNYERCSRHDGQKVRDYIKQNHVKSIIIDHHETADKDDVDLFINRGAMATAQEIYDLCFNDLELKGPADYIQTAMIGIYADSGGFVYTKDGTEEKLFNLVADLVKKGAKIEQVKNQLSQYSMDDIRVMEELLKNLNNQDDYTYSYLGDEFIRSWGDSGKSPAALKPALGTFLDEFLRNIEGRQWGFAVFRSILHGDDMYNVSFRSVNGVKDVAALAQKLDGGGHKPAAGGKLKAKSIQEAVEIIKKTIDQTP